MKPRHYHFQFSMMTFLIARIFLLAGLFAEQRMLEPTDVEPYALPPLEQLPPFPVVSSPPSFNFPISTPPMYMPKARPPQYEIIPPNIAPIPHYHVPNPPSTVLPSPPPHKKPKFAVWCVAKPTMPDPIIQEALDYACGSGADCKPIQPNGPCFQPNNLVSHASYAFNSYWQKKKVAGGTCDFGGTAMLVTVDPSYDNCHFIAN